MSTERLSPVIAVTYSSAELPAIGESIPWQLAFEAVVVAGGVPLAIDCSAPQPRVRDLIDQADGLILLGGGDVAPELYGAALDDPTIEDIDRTRDQNEFAAIASAHDLGTPMLAICRGLQLFNVARGGTLWADLRRDFDDGVEHRPGLTELVKECHEATVDPDSQVAKWMSTSGRVLVNSQHHQGVRELGEGLRVTARSDDGLVEAVETADGLAVGVQWHPEYLWPVDTNALALLSGFVGSCRQRNRVVRS